MTDQTAVAEQPSAPEKDPVLARVEERFGERLLEAQVTFDQPTFAITQSCSSSDCRTSAVSII